MPFNFVNVHNKETCKERVSPLAINPNFKMLSHWSVTGILLISPLSCITESTTQLFRSRESVWPFNVNWLSQCTNIALVWRVIWFNSTWLVAVKRILLKWCSTHLCSFGFSSLLGSVRWLFKMESFTENCGCGPFEFMLATIWSVLFF